MKSWRTQYKTSICSELSPSCESRVFILAAGPPDTARKGDTLAVRRCARATLTRPRSSKIGNYRRSCCPPPSSWCGCDMTHEFCKMSTQAAEIVPVGNADALHLDWDTYIGNGRQYTRLYRITSSFRPPAHIFTPSSACSRQTTHPIRPLCGVFASAWLFLGFPRSAWGNVLAKCIRLEHESRRPAPHERPNLSNCTALKGKRSSWNSAGFRSRE